MGVGRRKFLTGGVYLGLAIIIIINIHHHHHHPLPRSASQVDLNSCSDLTIAVIHSPIIYKAPTHLSVLSSDPVESTPIILRKKPGTSGALWDALSSLGAPPPLPPSPPPPHPHPRRGLFCFCFFFLSVWRTSGALWDALSSNPVWPVVECRPIRAGPSSNLV